MNSTSERNESSSWLRKNHFVLFQREYTEDCVFNETLEQHNYNTYSSVRWSTAKKTLYLGLNRHGQPRRVQAKGHNLGRLSAYARVLTQVAPPDRVEALHRRMLGAEHNVRHWHHSHNHHRQQSDMAQQSICPTLPVQEKDGRDRFRCRKRKKRKKRKRRCRPGERPGPQCQVPEELAMGLASEAMDHGDASTESTSATPESKRSCEGAASEEACRRQALSAPAKKRKSRIEGDPTAAVVGGRNLTLGKNKAPTSNAKKPNVGGDSQSKKPDLTDGKKRRRKGPPATQARGSVTVPPLPSRKRYALGTTSSSRASSSLTAPASAERASTAPSSSSPSLPGASTVPSVRRAASPPFGRRRSPPPSSRNHVARPVGSPRVGKSFPGSTDSPDRPRSTPSAASTTSSGEMARPYPTSSTTDKVPEITTLPLSPSAPDLAPPASSSSPWRESAEDFSRTLEDSSPVMRESTTETSDSTASTISTSEVVAERTTFRPIEEDGEDGDSDASPWTTTRFPIERLAM